MSYKQRSLFVVLLVLVGGLFFLVFWKNYQHGAVGQAVRSNHSALRPVAKSAATTAGADEFQSFNDWTENYRKASPKERPALEAKGVIFADARRKVLADLARNDPSRALGLVLSLAELANLPENIRAACEKPLSTIGKIGRAHV